MSDKQIPALFIKSKHEPYRRAGFEFSRAGIGIALAALTEAQVSLLKNDPHLVVEECTFPAEDADDTAAQAAAAEAAAKAAEEAAAAEAAAQAAEEAAAAEAAAKAAEEAAAAGAKADKNKAGKK